MTTIEMKGREFLKKYKDVALASMDVETFQVDGREALLVSDNMFVWACWKDNYETALNTTVKVEVASDDIEENLNDIYAELTIIMEGPSKDVALANMDPSTASAVKKWNWAI